MKDVKLTIEMLPKGAWNNDFSKTLPKKEWDILRNECYERANHKCQICGYATDELDAHEVWDFDVESRTQTLVDIIGICSKCHGVKHIRNSQRLGYGQDAKMHFINVNECSELEFASQLARAKMEFEERNKIYRWKLVADLSKFGLDNATIKEKNIPIIKDPYKDVEWGMVPNSKLDKLFAIERVHANLLGVPKVNYIKIDNYQGYITVSSVFVNKIEWFLDGVHIMTKYNVVGNFVTQIKVAGMTGRKLSFVLTGDGGETLSKTFELIPQEVI